MRASGQHLLAEYHGCDPTVLNDIDRIEALLRQAAQEADASIVASVFHPFTPHGVTGVVVVEESHLSIHTWPEHGYAAVDFYTCGDCNPRRADKFLRRELRASICEVMQVDRGMEDDLSMVVRDHSLQREEVNAEPRHQPLAGIVDARDESGVRVRISSGRG